MLIALLSHLEDCIGRPLKKVTEADFQRDIENLDNKDKIQAPAYAQSRQGEIIGLCLRGISEEQLRLIRFQDFGALNYLLMMGVSLQNYSCLSSLTNLTSLDLNSSNISDYSFLLRLTNLKYLNLRSNYISDISFLSRLFNLKSLNLRSNNISDISFLSDLDHLTSLDLSYNNISDVSFLSDLDHLTSLNLRSNNISDISYLSTLTHLEFLDLSYNNILDYSFLSSFYKLISLNLSSNNIRDVFPFLSGFNSLSSIDLSSNKISDIPQWLADRGLDILANVGYYSNCISVGNNPLKTPPKEVVEQGNEAIINYYTQLESQGKDALYEAKMLIVGEGEAGKTTMAHKIEEPTCPLPHIDDRTRGLTIHPHTFLTSPKGNQDTQGDRTFHLNIWDFGGQEIYHSTHRFFLSKRSLYVLVADNRKDDTDFNYWLNIIELFAGDSPLLIVLNEKDDIQRSVNLNELRCRYPETLKDIISVNFKTEEEPDFTKRNQRLTTIEKLIRCIEYQAVDLPHIGEPVPARWVDVRHAIETDDRNYIYREQFDELCHAQDITEPEDIATMLAYFHDLGIVLHFADQPLLRNRVILKPAWATNAVYRIFDNDTIKTKQGRFSRSDCAQLWSDDAYCQMHDVLIELMKRFRLVYEIERSNQFDTSRTGQLVAPQMLPQNTPDYPWDDTHPFQMLFRYDLFMPKGILWQFIVTLYRYIENHDWVWRNGVILHRGNTRAEVVENLQERRIYLRFSGPSIAEFRAIIIDQLDAISTAYHHLNYSKMIPCQCDTCRQATTPHFFEYARLKTRQETGKKSTIECQVSEADVPLNLLLQGFDIHSPGGRVDEGNPTSNHPSLGYSDSSLGYAGANPTYDVAQGARARLKLLRILNGLPTTQFDEFVIVLNPPQGIIPPNTSARGDRTAALLQWAEGSTGIGLAQLHDVLQLVISSDDP